MSTAGPESPTRPSAVVFDLGGVLIDWNPRYLYRQLFDDDAAMETFLAEICTPEWNLQQDAGRTWEEGVEVLSREHPGQRDLIAAYWGRWQEMFGDAIGPSVEILGELRRTGVRLFALSNWSAETFPIARPWYPFLEWFEEIVISGKVGLVKPDPRIFRLLLERHGLDPAATVFIDDSAANIRTATELRMRAIRFTGAAALRGELVALGLLDGATDPTHDGSPSP